MSRLPALLPLLVALSAASTASASPLSAEWNLRFRHESVDDAALAHEAKADSARLRLALRAALGKSAFLIVEGEGIAAAGNNYNSGANGRLAWPAITDPKGGEINQALVGWRSTRLGASAGRQKITWDNQRWIGNVGWRQNEQTFDAVSAEFNPNKDVVVRYAWLDRVHRVSGDDALDPLARHRRLDSHLVNVAV